MRDASSFSSPAASPQKAKMAHRILVVEDEESLALGLRDALMHAGYEVEVAHDGPGALKRIREGRYDLAVLDLMLPGKNGLEVLRELRQERHDIRVLILTGAPGAGKTTTARILAGRADRAVHLESDFFFRSNSRNLKIIRRHLDRHHPETAIIEGERINR